MATYIYHMYVHLSALVHMPKFSRIQSTANYIHPPGIILLLMPAAVSARTYVRTLQTAKVGNSSMYYILILILI